MRGSPALASAKNTRMLDVGRGSSSAMVNHVETVHLIAIKVLVREIEIEVHTVSRPQAG
jgi:hypothetical protein